MAPCGEVIPTGQPIPKTPIMTPPSPENLRFQQAAPASAGSGFGASCLPDCERVPRLLTLDPWDPNQKPRKIDLSASERKRLPESEDHGSQAAASVPISLPYSGS